MGLSSCSVVGVLGGSVLLVLTALHTDIVRFLPAFVTLTSHGCFVCGELVASKEDAIDRDFISVLENADITNTDVVVVEVIDCTIA